MKLQLPIPIVTESEQYVLNCMLANPEEVPGISALVRSADFYDERNRAVFDAILWCHGQSAHLSAQMLANRLSELGQYSRIGGQPYISGVMIDHFCTMGTVEYHAKRVRDRAFRRSVIELCMEASDEFKDALIDDIGERAGELCSKLAQISVQNAPTIVSTVKTGVGSYLERIDQGGSNAISTGLTKFDQDYGGLPTQGVVVVLGVNGSGKSSLVGNWICQMSYRHGWSGLVHSYEMGSAASICMAASETGVQTMEHLRHGTIPTKEEMQKLMAFMDHDGSGRVRFSERSMTASEIYTQACVDATRGDRFLVIDYVQNLPRRDRQDEVSGISEACITAQRISKELKMLVILVSQMTLDTKRKAEPPKRDDGVGGAAIGNVADMTVGVYRPCLWETKENFTGANNWDDRRRQAGLYVLKNKFGRTGSVDVEFNGATFKFADQGTSDWEYGGGNMEVRD